jgi:hypothetical protein
MDGVIWCWWLATIPGHNGKYGMGNLHEMGAWLLLGIRHMGSRSKSFYNAGSGTELKDMESEADQKEHTDLHLSL